MTLTILTTRLANLRQHLAGNPPLKGLGLWKL